MVLLYLSILTFRYTSQTSSLLNLKVGRKYYLEGIMIETHGGDHISLGFYPPGKNDVQLVTSHYLERYPNSI